MASLKDVRSSFNRLFEMEMAKKRGVVPTTAAPSFPVPIMPAAVPSYANVYASPFPHFAPSMHPAAVYASPHPRLAAQFYDPMAHQQQPFLAPLPLQQHQVLQPQPQNPTLDLSAYIESGLLPQALKNESETEEKRKDEEEEETEVEEEQGEHKSTRGKKDRKKQETKATASTSDVLGGTRCEGVTDTGSVCNRRALANLSYCAKHIEQASRPSKSQLYATDPSHQCTVINTLIGVRCPYRATHKRLCDMHRVDKDKDQKKGKDKDRDAKRKARSEESFSEEDFVSEEEHLQHKHKSAKSRKGKAASESDSDFVSSDEEGEDETEEDARARSKSSGKGKRRDVSDSESQGDSDDGSAFESDEEGAGGKKKRSRRDANGKSKRGKRAAIYYEEDLSEAEENPLQIKLSTYRAVTGTNGMRCAAVALYSGKRCRFSAMESGFCGHHQEGDAYGMRGRQHGADDPDAPRRARARHRRIRRAPAEAKKAATTKKTKKKKEESFSEAEREDRSNRRKRSLKSPERQASQIDTETIVAKRTDSESKFLASMIDTDMIWKMASSVRAAKEAGEHKPAQRQFRSLLVRSLGAHKANLPQIVADIHAESTAAATAAATASAASKGASDACAAPLEGGVDMNGNSQLEPSGACAAPEAAPVSPEIVADDMLALEAPVEPSSSSEPKADEKDKKPRKSMSLRTKKPASQQSQPSLPPSDTRDAAATGTSKEGEGAKQPAVGDTKGKGRAQPKHDVDAAKGRKGKAPAMPSKEEDARQAAAPGPQSGPAPASAPADTAAAPRTSPRAKKASVMAPLQRDQAAAAAATAASPSKSFKPYSAPSRSFIVEEL